MKKWRDYIKKKELEMSGEVGVEDDEEEGAPSDEVVLLNFIIL